jgi:hypothetical protein
MAGSQISAYRSFGWKVAKYRPSAARPGAADAAGHPGSGGGAGELGHCDQVTGSVAAAVSQLTAAAEGEPARRASQPRTGAPTGTIPPRRGTI